jgi:CheY-like chemotaxis protein
MPKILASSGSSIRVVVIDDEVEIKDVLCEELEERFPVTGFLDVESALRDLPHNDEPIIFALDDCPAGRNVLLDKQVLLKQRLKSQFPSGHYVWMSDRAYQDRIERKDAEAAGFDAFLNKPFAVLELIRVIEKLDNK